jgi:hypothetical protein
MVLHGEGQILPVLGIDLDGTSAAIICPDCVYFEIAAPKSLYNLSSGEIHHVY